MEYSYTPYQKKEKHKRSRKWSKIKLPTSWKKWFLLMVAILIIVLIVLYNSLGELKFFTNRYLGLSFFKKNYLIILQNNYELRPGGGFLTAYGNLDFVMGVPTNLEFKNSYDIDTQSYVTPPYPHEELLKNEWYEGYTFRDANWEPDFRQSALELINFYNQKFPDKDVDGIIVLNFSLIEELIDALGGIELDGKMLTKQNLFSELEFQVNNIDRHNVEALENRKDVLSELGKVIVSQIKRHPYKTRNVLVEGLESKDLYVWMAKPGLQEKLMEKGWANAMRRKERADFLGVNLANLGSKKADRYLQTETNYYANITKEVPEVTLEVALRYPGFTNTFSDNYKGYLRVYLPKEADITSMPVDSVESEEGDFKVLGTKVILPAGSKSSLNYIYTLPRNTFVLDHYQLRLAKQSGSEMFYKITVEAEEGSLLESDQLDTRENRAQFHDRLKNDMDFSLRVLPDTTPPYPVEQEFESLTKVNIIWNEPMEETSSLVTGNYAFTDLNRNSPDVSDEVTVLSASLIEPNIVQLEVEGVTEQTLEHYLLKLSSLKDANGNVILPNPKDITVVQRFGPKRETAEEPGIGVIPDVEPGPAVEDTTEAPSLVQ